MSLEDPDRPPSRPSDRWMDPDLSARSDQADGDYTLLQAMDRGDGDSVAFQSRVIDALNWLRARCWAQLHPDEPAQTPASETAERIRARERHLTRTRHSIEAQTTIPELRALHATYAALVRAGLHDPTIDSRLDELVAQHDSRG